MKRNLLLIFMAFTVPAYAADAEPDRNLIDFSVERSAQVQPDRLEVMMFAEAESDDAASAADQVNLAINSAMDILSKNKQINTQSQGYTTRPVYQKDRIRRWRARRGVRLVSDDFEAIGLVLGSLENHLAIQSVQFQISPKLSSEVQDKLIRESLLAFRARSDLVVASLGKSGYEIVRVSVNSQGRNPVYRRSNLAMAEAAVADVGPELSPGASTVTVLVNGTIQLLD